MKRFVLLLAAASALSAQMGSPGGGETQAIALHPTDANLIYAGAARGLCKTTQGGLDNWPAVGLETYSPRVIVLSPDNPDVVYAGTYEMGVWKSSDAGATWRNASAGITDRRIRGLAIDPGNGNTVFAGTDGGGVFRTTDGGVTWTERNHGLFDKVIRTLVIDPTRPRMIYAATWHGVYKSTDGAENWTASPEGLYDVDVTALTLDPTNPEVLYAGTNPRGVYRSTDGGINWTRGKEVLGEYILSIAVDPASSEHVYVGTKAGVWRSADRGDTFERAGLAWSNAAWTLVFDARTTPPTLYYGGIGGILKTINGGQWWDVTGPQRK
jgi:photosystem II stability/assembly factor-like uncharacterized protein